jgi:phosphoserine phosphatase RsbU/P
MNNNLAWNENHDASSPMKQVHNNNNKPSANRPRANDDKYRDILQTIDEGYFEIDLKGNITFCNNAACAILGYPREKLITMNNREFSTENSARKVFSAFRDISQTGRSSIIHDFEIVRGDGSISTVGLSAGLITDPDARPTGFHGIIRQSPCNTVTDTDLILKSYAVEKSIIAIAIIDPSGSFTYVNNAFLRMWGYDDRSQIAGDSFLDSFHPDDRGNIMEMMDVLSELGSWVGELSLKKKDDTGFFVILSASIIKNERDVDIGTIVSFVDITLRKKIDVALKESQHDLSKRNEFMAKEMKIARTTVRDIIKTSLPRIDSLSVDFRHRPMNEIGGDFFCFYPYDRDTVGVFICDISGHGVASSLYLSLLKSIADRLSVTCGRSPVEYLTRLNHELVGRISSYFITGIYGLFSRSVKTGHAMLSYANGGHPGPILVSREGKIKLHSMKSTLIGISNDVSFNSSAITLEPGDRLYLYTDGIPETANRSRTMIGYDYRLLDLFTKSSHLTLSENLDAIMERIDVFRDGSEVTDDLLIIGFEAGQ